MKYLIAAAVALLPSVALAQWPGQCVPGQNPNTLGCAPAANAPISSDLVWGWQQTHNPHTVAMQVGQIIGAILPWTGGLVGSTVANGISSPSGDNVGTLDFNASSINFERQILTGTPNGPGVFVGFNVYSPSYVASPDGIVDAIPALQINATTEPATTGSVIGGLFHLYSLATPGRAFTNEDQALGALVDKWGQNSTWQFSTQTTDHTGVPPASFASIGWESDIVANGQDDPVSLYDPSHGNRAFILLVPKALPTPSFAANSAYAVGALVFGVPMSASAGNIYIVTVAGTSGGTAPSWPVSGSVTSGGVTFTYSETFSPSVGRGIFLGRDVTYTVSYSSGFATNALFDNAVIDLSEAVLSHSYSAGIRLAPNMVLDMAAQGTALTQNIRTQGYSATGSAWVYQISGTTAFDVTDAFRTQTAGITQMAGPQASLSGISTGYGGYSLTAGFNASGVGGETDLVTDQNGLSVYVPNSSGIIVNASPVLGLDASGDLTISGVYKSGASVGVSCSGAPTGSYATVNGIVTHC